MAELTDTLEGPPIEQHGRTHNSTYSGMEIVRKFHVPKWSDFHSVQRALHGRVVDQDGTWTRTPPLRDTYVKSAYCNETQVDFAHPNAPKTIPSLSSGGAVTIKEQLENQAETLQKGTAGAVITAHYRPLITAWQPTPTGEGDEPYDDNIWDWIDPVFTPGFMQFPWPGGLHAAVDAEKFDTRDIPTEAAQPIQIPVSDLSIKRILVGEVPWGAISQLGNVINEEEWPAQGSPAANGLGLSFPAGTLKFVDPDIVNMIDAEGNRWYEITLNFKWIHKTSNRLFGDDGKPDPSGWITWNHMFTRPSGFITGWYRVFKSGARNVGPFNLDWIFPGEALTVGNLHQEGSFDNLFKLNQEAIPAG